MVDRDFLVSFKSEKEMISWKTAFASIGAEYYDISKFKLFVKRKIFNFFFFFFFLVVTDTNSKTIWEIKEQEKKKKQAVVKRNPSIMKDKK